MTVLSYRISPREGPRPELRGTPSTASVLSYRVVREGQRPELRWYRLPRRLSYRISSRGPEARAPLASFATPS